MNRPILAATLFLVATAALGAQQASPSDPYQGTSNPPTNDDIITTSEPQAKPPAGRLAAPASAQSQQSTYSDASSGAPTSANDDGIVQVQQRTPAPSGPILNERSYAADPDGDIVHPHPLGPGELGAGTTIRVKLLRRLSTAYTEKGEAFSTKVASDVVRDGQVLIPAGAQIDGHVVEASSGHFGGHGTMRLRPETVILPDGSRYALHADLSSTPGSKTRLGSEGTVNPGSRIKRDSVEYGGAVGAGATTGAILGGPVGALTGSLIGVGVVTTHLLVSHPQAVLESGTTLMFTLSETLSMVPAPTSGS